jgi:hypothetical protein
MNRLMNVLSVTAILIVWVMAGNVAAADKDITGWETDSPYNQLYNPKERDSIKGTITKFITVKPMKGMAPGTAFYLDEGDGERLLVHVCPKSYATARETGLQAGDWVKIKGAWMDIEDETVFVAAKIKKDSGYSYKVRLSSDGTPFWTMPPEQLEAELAAVE